MFVKTITKPILFLLLSCIAAFVVLHLVYRIFNQAYLWDELGVYSRAAIYLYEHSLSIFPDAIPDELSRGHPTLCVLYYGIWFKLFGCTPFVGHIAAAAIYLVSCVFTYLILSMYMKQWLSAFTTLIIFLQPMFLAQSILILPESLLMCTTIISVYSYLKRNIWLTCVFLLLSLQIKESALILPIAFLITEMWTKKSFNWTGFIAYFFIPIAGFALFLLVQKLQRGYYFYPLHTSLLQFDKYYIHLRWNELKSFMWLEQGRYILLLILTLSLFYYKKIKKQQLFNSEILLPIIVIGGIGFSIFNYFLSRYTLLFMLPYYIGILLFIHFLLSQNIKYYIISLSVIAIVTTIHIQGFGKFTDVDFSYTYHIKNLQTTLTELDQPIYTGKTIRMDFPLAACYWGEKNGYNRKADYTIELNKSKEAEFVVFTNPGNMSDTANLSSDYVFFKEIKTKIAYSRIYKNSKNRQ